MTGKDIYRNMSGIDPQIILAAAPAQGKQKNHSRAWGKRLSLAAGFCLIIAAMITFLPYNRETGIPDDTRQSMIDNQPNTTDPNTLTSAFVFESFEAFEQHERNAGTKAVSCYYIPSSLPADYELSRITKRDDVYIMIEYKVPTVSVSAEELSEYDAERLQTLICRYSLFADGKKALEENFINNGYVAIEYDGKTYYRWDEHAENDPTKRVIGYEIAFIEDGKLIFMHLPAIDTFENMMKHAKVIKVDIK